MHSNAYHDVNTVSDCVWVTLVIAGAQSWRSLGLSDVYDSTPAACEARVGRRVCGKQHPVSREQGVEVAPRESRRRHAHMGSPSLST